MQYLILGEPGASRIGLLSQIYIRQIDLNNYYQITCTTQTNYYHQQSFINDIILSSHIFTYITFLYLFTRYYKYTHIATTMSKSKKPQFKNPFELDDEDEEQIPIQETYYSSSSHDPIKVHNPLPFNPYEIKQQPTAKTTNNSSKRMPEPPKPQPFEPVPYSRKEPNQEPSKQRTYQLNEDGDPPLLQDIGIQPDLIFQRMKLVLRLKKPDEETLEDPDLSGPIMIALCFGFLLLLSGKIHFGDIYAIFVVGNILLYFLFNFMSQVDIIPLYNIMSTVGYALIPMLLLGLCGIFTSLKGTGGILLSLAVSGWASLAASNFIEALMRQTQADRKPLLLYPMFLFYMSFAMIIIF